MRAVLTFPGVGGCTRSNDLSQRKRKRQIPRPRDGFTRISYALPSPSSRQPSSSFLADEQFLLILLFFPDCFSKGPLRYELQSAPFRS